MYHVNHHYSITENAELIGCRSNVLTNYKISFMFCYRFVSGPVKQHHPTHVLARCLPINKTEAIHNRSEEERSTEEGKRNQSISQRCFNNSGYTLVLINEQINKANNSDRPVG